MSSEPSQLETMKPYLIIAGILFIILLGVIMWPTAPETTTPKVAEVAMQQPQTPDIANTVIEEVSQPEVFEAPKMPTEVVITPDMEVDDFEVTEVTEIANDIPLGAEDPMVKSSLIAAASSPMFARLVVNDRLLEKFVINVNNLASAQLSPKDALLVTPEGKFKTVKQADSIFIDSASFSRYDTYVAALESVDTQELLTVFDSFEANIKRKFAEISRPGQSFDLTLINAINTLLSTPDIQEPLEVYSDSAMFKFKDARLERLSAPQKQLLRTGPENTRRIKRVLEELKTSLEARQ